MRVLYDSQTVITQTMGGVSRYFVNLMEDMDAQGVQVECLLPEADSLQKSGNVYVKNHESFFLPPTMGWRLLMGIARKLPVRIRDWVLRKIWRVRQQFRRADVVHAGQFVVVQGGLLVHKNLVTTVHDMIHENYFLNLPEVHPFQAHYSFVKHEYVRRSKHIIAITHFTKKELIRIWNVPEEKISVVHHANPFENVQIPPRQEVALPYVLYVGTRDHYKNFPLFVQAVAPILMEKKDLRVICTGNQPLSDAERELLQGEAVYDRFDFVSVSDAELVQLYVDAELFCFPSRMEGFGLPILEAFSCGCPVCCADATCFPEVAGEAACYFDPESAADMEAALRRVLDDRDYREQLIAAGHQRAALFTRAKTAEETLAVYRKCMAC